MSENRRGADHHNWKGGGRAYFGRWVSVREKALQRDEHQCRVCGKTPEEIGRNPDAHHIVPMKEFDDVQESHTLDNLISLCPQCHADAERGAIEVSSPSPDSSQE